MSGTRTRTIDFLDPALTAGGALGRTGIEFLRDMVAGTVPPAPIQATLGFTLVEVQDGFARYELKVGEHLYGPMNVAHGGVAATLLEAAMSAAVMTTLDALTAPSPSSLVVHSTRALTLRAAKVLAEGWVVHRGSRLVTAEGRLNDAEGRLLAHGSSTYTLIERPAT